MAGKTKKVSTVKFVTPVMRASYVHVYEKNEYFDTPEYSCALLLSKEKEDDIKSIKQHIIKAVVLRWGKDKKKWPKGLDNPLRNGDSEDHADKGEAYKGCVFLSSHNTSQPGVIGKNGKPLMDPELLYSGCYVRASLTFRAYDAKGNQGVSVYLNSIMVVGDGERLDNKSDPEEDFKEFIDEDADTGDDDPSDGLDDFLDDDISY